MVSAALDVRMTFTRLLLAPMLWSFDPCLIAYRCCTTALQNDYHEPGQWTRPVKHIKIIYTKRFIVFVNLLVSITLVNKRKNMKIGMRFNTLLRVGRRITACGSVITRLSGKA